MANHHFFNLPNLHPALVTFPVFFLAPILREEKKSGNRLHQTTSIWGELREITGGLRADYGRFRRGQADFMWLLYGGFTLQKRRLSSNVDVVVAENQGRLDAVGKLGLHLFPESDVQ